MAYRSTPGQGLSGRGSLLFPARRLHPCSTEVGSRAGSGGTGSLSGGDLGSGVVPVTGFVVVEVWTG